MALSKADRDCYFYNFKQSSNYRECKKELLRDGLKIGNPKYVREIQTAFKDWLIVNHPSVSL